MKIGIMLRHLDQHGGVLQYTHTIVRQLIGLDTPHEFVLMYRNPKYIGMYGNNTRVREVCIQAPSAFLWDQVAVRLAEKKEKFDLIFNPKYSLPLTAKSRTVFICHGLDWYVMPWGSRWTDRLSHQHLIPRYVKKADDVIAVSHTARQHMIQYLGIDEDRVHAIYLGVDEAFGQPIPQERLEEIKRAYQLPDRYFLFAGQIFPNKNFGRLVQAYAKVGPELGIPLVVAGTHTWKSEDEIALIDQLGISDWVLQPGWIDRETLPTFYALAEALIFPSLYEACPSPLLEAMSSGCPIVTADRHGTAELAGEAAALVDPEDVESIAEGMRRVVCDQGLRQQLIQAGRQRVKDFSWEKCARQTLEVLESVGGHQRSYAADYQTLTTK
jgi:glycosyltransferase involved in cell wall biosynthesis